MANAWGLSWGDSWGSSWGGVLDPGTAITNLFASEAKSQYLVDDRTGFKVEVRGEGLVRDGHLTSVMTRSKSRDSYHPQEHITSRPDAQRGPVSPESDDVFVGTITVDDL